MFCKYNNDVYQIIYFRKKWKLITNKEEKCDSTFLKNWSYYEKEYNEDDPMVQDVFDIKFSVCWDSQLEHVDTTWELFTDKEYLQDNKVLLRFTKGLLPGWKSEEQTVCSKYVPIEECSGFTICYDYHIRDGKKLESVVREQQKVLKEQFINTMLQYQSENI